jgi:hypothetical protein
MSLILLVAAFLGSPAAHALADGDEDAPETASAPAGNGRAVRLSFVEGAVRVTQGDQVVADPAVANMPLFEGAEIATANEGRAEIQLEDGSIARLSPNTVLDFTGMQLQGTATRTEITLRSGLAYFELQPSNAEHRLRIRYADASFTASDFSIVRLTSDAPPAELAVLSGNIRLERASALQLDVHAGESLTLDAADLSRYNLASSITPNSWDNWNADRDQFLSSEAADQTSASGNLKDYPSGGLSDLDANGNWYNVPGQGYVWSPYDAQDAGAGWDPYGYGSWVSYPQYGYIWVSGYSWGYSPFQCGLWDYYEDFGWAWAPGNGCMPWWGYGGGGWGGWTYRIGNNRPPGYHPPYRPRPPLRSGRLHPEESLHAGAGHAPAHSGVAPIISVDRRAGGGGAIAVEREGGPVMIAGHPVEPLRPVAPHSGYRPSGVNPGRGLVAQPADPTTGYTIFGTTRPSNGGNPRTVYTPPARTLPGNPGIRTYQPRAYEPRPEPTHSMPPPRSYTPPPAPHMSPPPPPPHVSAPAPHK